VLELLSDDLYAKVFEFLAHPSSEPLAVCDWAAALCQAFMDAKFHDPNGPKGPCPEVSDAAFRAGLIAFGPPPTTDSPPSPPFPANWSWRKVFFGLCAAFKEPWWRRVHQFLTVTHPSGQAAPDMAVRRRALHMARAEHLTLTSESGSLGAATFWQVSAADRASATATAAATAAATATTRAGQAFRLRLKPLGKRQLDYLYQITHESRPPPMNPRDREGPTPSQTFFWFMDHVRASQGVGGAESVVTAQQYNKNDEEMHRTLVHYLLKKGDENQRAEDQTRILELLRNGHADVWAIHAMPPYAFLRSMGLPRFWETLVDESVKDWLRDALHRGDVLNAFAPTTSMQLALMTQDVELVAEMLRHAMLPRPAWSENDLPALAVFAMSGDMFEQRMECVAGMLNILLHGAVMRGGQPTQPAAGWRPTKKATAHLNACTDFGASLPGLLRKKLRDVVPSDVMQRHLDPLSRTAMLDRRRLTHAMP
tara:strand:+ start:137 stop:1579 length:1443 start_codon:yes stop_codon:yes gene_type:complete